MKNRCHRLPSSASPDDWVDGSWTVDCSCGVTFDDGEEMVSCDECGIWVHTRCSRFVKGEASFACHNCKKNNNNNNTSSNLSKKPSSVAPDTEETEVAQLLVELPTKTDPRPPPNPFPAPAYRTPFRLWAEVPLEDRVHVQGVPGGDPSLFQGISSSVFTSELWRCTGYVPKKFNFQYREFSCWDEDGEENTASRGADVLFSLSKEIVPSCNPIRAFDRKQEGSEKVLFGSRLQSWGKKERNKLHVFGSHSSKRRKEEAGEVKDRSGKKKKKVRSDTDRVTAEFKKRGSVPVVDVKKAGLSENGGLQVAESGVPSVKSEEKKDDGLSEQSCCDQVEGGDSGKKKKKARSAADRVAAEFKRRSSILVADMNKAGSSEDKVVLVTEPDVPSVKSEEREEAVLSQKLDAPSVKSEERGEAVLSQKLDAPSTKSEERKEDIPSQNNPGDQVERMDSDSKPKHVLVIKASKGPTDEAPSTQYTLEVCVKVETLDGTAVISSQADVSVESQEKHDDNVKESVKEEDLSKAVHGLKQPTDYGHFQGDSNNSTKAKPAPSGSFQKKEKMNHPVPQQPSKILGHSMSMHSPASASTAATLGDEQDLSKVVHGLKQQKDESHLQGDRNGSIWAKLVPSGPCQKNEKMNQPVPQPPSKLLSHSMSMHPPASSSAPTNLSDEELALLLHQELNSSPRVPRVPRMRQASGMQLTSQSAPSMLSKRSSYSGGKDQVVRRKNKEEASRDGSRNSQESIDETKKAGRAMSSPDRKHQESSFTTDGSAKKDSRSRSHHTTVSSKKNTSGASTEGENSCQSSFEACGQNLLSIKSSPRDVPDDATPRTLPGLIGEIMSKHKCSTYEELCNAVRPHWHNVRKLDGDRYAYSSHSHAVLDCLRNRSEWAHLIDRGPKTNSSKRRRKLDSDTPTVEESENEEAKSKTSSREVEDKNEDSQREDFPKGKRKARKRRRLELRGRSVEEARKRKHAASSGSAIVSDDGDNNDDESAGAYSHSSNEGANDGADGIFSEDESQGAVERTSRAEASASTSSNGS